MKEDILEQLIEDWYVSKPGWFVKHNLKFRPHKNHAEYISNKDSVHSDIDILAFASGGTKTDRVHVVSCKSWQGGFNVKSWISILEGEAAYNEKNSANFQPREGWKYFRELVSDKWLQSFLNVVELETGQRDLTYVVAVTKMNGTQEEKAQFENLEILKERFKKHGSELQIKIINLEDIIIGFKDRLREKETPALEATEVGRLLQLFNAADFKIIRDGVEIGGRNGTARPINISVSRSGTTTRDPIQ